MMLPAEAYEEECHFLHDLRQPLAVAHGQGRLMISKLQNQAQPLPTEVLIAKAEQIVQALNKIDKMLSARRELINTLEQERKDKAAAA